MTIASAIMATPMRRKRALTGTHEEVLHETRLDPAADRHRCRRRRARRAVALGWPRPESSRAGAPHHRATVEAGVRAGDPRRAGAGARQGEADGGVDDTIAGLGTRSAPHVVHQQAL